MRTVKVKVEFQSFNVNFPLSYIRRSKPDVRWFVSLTDCIVSQYCTFNSHLVDIIPLEESDYPPITTHSPFSINKEQRTQLAAIREEVI